MKSIKPQLELSQKAKKSLLNLTESAKNNVLNLLANKLLAQTDDIISVNRMDLLKMNSNDSKYDRLKLTEERVVDLANGIRAVTSLKDPTGVLLSSNVLANGLLVEKKTVPLGVVAVIYEARPNVTIDVAALCLKSGNVCLLRGGTDAWYTNSYLVKLIQESLNEASVDPNIVQLLPTDRELVLDLLSATDYVDIIIPRGSQVLIDFVRKHAKVPVIETGAGVCHTYIDEWSDLDMAARIVANAKISRPSVCNALDTILVHERISEDFIARIVPYFQKAEVEVYAQASLVPIFRTHHFEKVREAGETDFGREFLDLTCSIKSVSNLEEALAHIAKFSSKHSECIVSNNSDNIANFMNQVDAAAVYSNASTRFTDGGEFGLGAEIGISTQKLHARGPFALEKLVTEKWFVSGDGQVR